MLVLVWWFCFPLSIHTLQAQIFTNKTGFIDLVQCKSSLASRFLIEFAINALKLCISKVEPLLESLRIFLTKKLQIPSFVGHWNEITSKLIYTWCKTQPPGGFYGIEIVLYIKGKCFKTIDDSSE